MTPKRKKKLTYIVIGFFFLLGGIEYAVILPTAWLYLSERFDSQPYMLGLLMSAFCLSGLVAAPLMGRWSDRVGGTRNVLLFANLWEIAGNIMYFLGISPWFLVTARFIAGVGTGVGPALFADIARVTTTEDRTAVMSVFMAIRQFGLVAGPGCNLFLRTINMEIGSYPLDKFTAPGLFMAVLWLALQLLVLCLYWDLPKLHLNIQHEALQGHMEYENIPDDEPSMTAPPTLHTNVPALSSSPSINRNMRAKQISEKCSPQENQLISPTHQGRNMSSDLDTLFTSSNEMIESAERYMGSSYESSISPVRPRRYPGVAQQFPDGTHRQLSGEEYAPDALIDTDSVAGNSINADIPFSDDTTNMLLPAARGELHSSSPDVTTRSWRFFYNEYMREEVIVILTTVFVSMFGQLSLETMVTPLTKRLLDWEELQNSWLYAAAGVQVLVVFGIIRFVSRCCHDRYLLLFGCIVNTVMNAYLLWYLPLAKPHDSANLPYLIVGVFFNLFSIPFLVVSSISLFSKITNEQTQGFSQGLRRMSGGLGNLLGPLWAGALINHMYVMMGVNLALMVTATMMLLLSFNKFKTEQSSQSQNIQPGAEEERRPLLS